MKNFFSPRCTLEYTCVLKKLFHFESHRNFLANLEREKDQENKNSLANCCPRKQNLGSVRFISDKKFCLIGCNNLMKMVTKIFYRLTAQILYKTKHIQQNTNWGRRTPNFLWRPFQDRRYNVLKYTYYNYIHP